MKEKTWFYFILILIVLGLLYYWFINQSPVVSGRFTEPTAPPYVTPPPGPPEIIQPTTPPPTADNVGVPRGNPFAPYQVPVGQKAAVGAALKDADALFPLGEPRARPAPQTTSAKNVSTKPSIWDAIRTFLGYK